MKKIKPFRKYGKVKLKPKKSEKILTWKHFVNYNSPAPQTLVTDIK